MATLWGETAVETRRRLSPFMRLGERQNRDLLSTSCYVCLLLNASEWIICMSFYSVALCQCIKNRHIEDKQKVTLSALQLWKYLFRNRDWYEGMISCRCLVAHPFSEILPKVCHHGCGGGWKVCFHSFETTLNFSFCFHLYSWKHKNKSGLSHKIDNSRRCCFLHLCGGTAKVKVV